MDTAPEQFNAFFIDRQLGSKLAEARGVLRRVLATRARQVQERKRALMIVSRGEAGLLTAAPVVDTSNFSSVARTLRELEKEITNFVRKGRSEA